MEVALSFVYNKHIEITSNTVNINWPPLSSKSSSFFNPAMENNVFGRAEADLWSVVDLVQ